MPGASGGDRTTAPLARIGLRSKLVVVGAIVFVLLAAIGGGVLAHAARRPADTRQFLAQSSGFVAFLAYVPEGGSLSGTLYVSSLAPGATSTTNYRYAFTGTSRGSRIRIDLASVDPAGSSTLVGQIRGGDLVLPLWQEGGPTVSRTLMPSSVTAYRSAAARLDEVASHNAERDLDAREVDAAAAALNAGYGKVVAEESAVSGYDHPFGEDVSQAEADYEQTLVDAQAAEQSSHATCAGLAAVVVHDQSNVLSDQYVVEGDQEALAADLAEARNDLASLRAEETAYRQALALAPERRDPVPTPAEIRAAEQALSQRIAASGQTMQGYVAETSGYAQQARALARTAGQVCS